jgi:carbamoyl-phosphate synthase small subunit
MLPPGTTGVLVLADGTVFCGKGVGRMGAAVGEVCFNTAITGYQEILTDPSYMGQIVAFTFPHVGNVGTNAEDLEQLAGGAETAACGAIFRDLPTAPANWRASDTLNDWLEKRGVIGLAGIDTRALTNKIRRQGMPHAVIAHSPDGAFDLDALKAQARAWIGIDGQDLASEATTPKALSWSEEPWTWPEGYGEEKSPRFEVVVMDFGVKRNILRSLAKIGARATVVPARTTAAEILARKPDGVLISNGPGDPAATAAWAGREIKALADSGVPVMGICLGHQMLALALGARTMKMDQGHHGANHPVKDLATGKVEVVSMNHGFAVDRDSLPEGVEETHVSLFDGTNAGIKVKGKPVFSVQHHPEASPGPMDSLYLFDRFADLMRARQKAKA